MITYIFTSFILVIGLMIFILHSSLGPFGALMTLQYGLTGAPVTQPRNIILGQMVAGIIALSFTYVPETHLSPLLRMAIAPSVSITTMVKLGVVHPPAGN